MRERKNEHIKVFALGGAGEIGKNMYVVEIDEDIFVIDAGSMFPEDEMLGIDMVIPDISYLTDHAERIKGIFLTHGHEDHIGALSYVLRKMSVPVYGTRLTIGLVEAKLKEVGIDKKVKLQLIDSDTELSIGNVTISFFAVNHSIPDAVGICFHTSQGAIVHTGDFKFDPTPVDGKIADYHKMSAIGKSGVLCLLSDSTNAERPGSTGSESSVGQELSDVFYSAKGRVILATFASNIHRIQQVMNTAHEYDRKVAIIGKSIQHTIDLSIELGYLHVPKDTMVSIQDLQKYPDHKITILTTGAQGEPMAALTRIARGSHKQITIKPGDTVVIAATPIPGNETSVSKAVDLLFRAGADVIYGQKRVHVSGHGCQEELKLMLNMMKPKYFVPIHGEYKMLISHANLAESVGVHGENIFIIENGEVVEFKDGTAKRTEKVAAGNILVDGLGVGDVGNIVLRDRRLLSQDGILVVVVTLSKTKNAVVSGPEILSRGFVYVRESEQLFEKSTDIVKEILDKAIQNNMMDWTTLKANIRDSLGQYLFDKTKRRPMILPIIMEV